MTQWTFTYKLNRNVAGNDLWKGNSSEHLWICVGHFTRFMVDLFDWAVNYIVKILAIRYIVAACLRCIIAYCQEQCTTCMRNIPVNILLDYEVLNKYPSIKMFRQVMKHQFRHCLHNECFHLNSAHRYQLCTKFIYPSPLLWQINGCNH